MSLFRKITALVLISILLINSLPAFAIDTFEDSQARSDSILVKYKNDSEIKVVALKRGESVAQAIKRYQRLKKVEYAEPNYIVEASAIPSDSSYTNQWYLKRIHAEEAWDINNSSPTITIAVIDSGIQVTHPDIFPNIWKNNLEISGNKKDDDKNGYVDDIYGWDFVNNVADPAPKFKGNFTEGGIIHGTVIAGIAAGVGNNGIGISGITWKTKIMALKALDDRGNGDMGAVIKSINYAVAKGADIINLSFVGFAYSRGLEQAIGSARDAGVIVVAPAGNEQAASNGVDLNKHPLYPACYRDAAGAKMVVGVAATDALDQKTIFSGYGSSCIDIAAPGVSFYSTSVYAPNKSAAGRFFNLPYDGYWSGTSMAVPIISGTLALIQGTNPSLSPQETLSVLLNTAENINALNPDFRNQLGKGRVNVAEAVLQAALKLKNKKAHFAFSSDSVGLPVVSIADENGFAERSFLAYPSEFIGGINIAAGDLNGDGVDEIITAPRSGKESDIRIFNPSGTMLNHFLAYPYSFKGGVVLSSADIDGDGRAEIITAPASNSEALVKVFKADGTLLKSFLAYPKTFKNGISLTVADITSAPGKEIVTAPGKGGIPQVKVFSSKGTLLSNFIAGSRSDISGLNVAAADIDGTPRRRAAEIIVSHMSGASQVALYDFRGNLRSRFNTYDAPFAGNTGVIAADLNRDGFTDIITVPGMGGGPHIRVFDRTGMILHSFYAFDPDSSTGVRAAVFLTK